MKTGDRFTEKSKQGLCRLALVAAMLVIPPYAATSAQQTVEDSGVGGSVALTGKTRLMQAGYIMVGYEKSDTQDTSALNVHSVLGAPAVLTCNIEKGAVAESRDCNGSAQTMYYAFTGDRHFSQEIEFSDELITKLQDDSGTSVAINVTYL